MLSVLLPLSPGYASETSPLQTTVILTNSISSTSPQTLFSPYDTIYAAITVAGLIPGFYRADVSWSNESGSVTQYTPVSFIISPGSSLDEPAVVLSHSFYSWFHLMKNGPFKSGVSGAQFDADHLGKWELRIAINNSLLAKVIFEIN